jgi:autotransporter translocation and assembly factor TamB
MQASDNASRFRRWVIAIAIALTTLLLLAGAYALIMQSDWGKEKITSKLSDTLKDLGWKAHIETIEGALSHEIVLHDISLTSDEGDQISIKSLRIGVSFIHLLKKQIRFTLFHADHVRWTISEATIPRPMPTSAQQNKSNFTIFCPDLHLTHIETPFLPLIADISGQLRMGRSYRSVYAHLSARFIEPAASSLLTLTVRPNHHTQLAADFDASLLRIFVPSLPIDTGTVHFYIKGNWNAFAALRQTNISSDLLTGYIHANIHTDGTAHSIPMPFLWGGEWSLTSAFQVNPGKDLEFWNFNATNASLRTTGRGMIDWNGRLAQSSLQLSIHDLRQTGLASLEGSMDLHVDGQEKTNTTVKLHSQKISWQNQTFEHLNASLQLEPEKVAAKPASQPEFREADSMVISENSGYKGRLEVSFDAFEEPWTAQSDVTWDLSAVELTRIGIHSSNTQIEGNVAAGLNRCDGEIRVRTKNLHHYITPCYGALDATVRLKTDAFSQTAKIDAKTANLYFEGIEIEKGFLYADLSNLFGRINGHAYFEAQQALWKTVLAQNFSIKTSSTDDRWIMAIRTNGEWKDPFDIQLNGEWQINGGLFEAVVQDASGRLLSHDLSLPAPVRVTWTPQQCSIDNLSIKMGDAAISAHLDCNSDLLNADLQMRHVPLDFLSLNPLNLSVSGFVDLKASFLQKQQVAVGSLSAQFNQVTIGPIEQQSPTVAQGSVSASLTNQRLTCDVDLDVGQSPLLRIAADLPVSIAAFPLNMQWHDAGIEAALSFHGKIEELLDFFNIGANHLEGDCLCHLRVSDTLSNPRIHGECTLEHGRYENYYSGFQLRNLTARIIGKDHSLQLEALQAQDSQNKGSLSASGKWTFSLKDRCPFQLKGHFSRMNITDIAWLQAEADGTAHIFGDWDAAHVNANINVLEGDVSIPERIPHPLPKLQVKYVNTFRPTASTALSSFSYPIFLDLHIHAPENIFVSGRGLSSEWKGKFDIKGTGQNMETHGQLELMNGEFLFSGRAFKLTEGALTFSGKAREVPLLNLAGQMDLEDLRILARLKGPLNAPQLVFQSSPPLPMGSIVSHLLFGQDLSDVNALQAAQIVNSLATFSPDSANFSQTVRHSLGVDRLRIIATPTNDEGGQSIALQVGKYVTRGVLVSVSQGPEGGTTNLSVEVDLTNGFSFQAASQQEQEQGKFTLKWNLNY